MALIDKQTALDALMAKRERLLDHGQAGAEHILTHCGYNVIDELPTVPAIPIDWIEAQIPDSTEFYAVVTAIILRHLIDEYRKEKHNEQTE